MNARRYAEWFGLLLTGAFILLYVAAGSQPPPAGGGGDPPCWPPPCIPITEGIGFLVAAGLAYGSKKLWRKRHDG